MVIQPPLYRWEPAAALAAANAKTKSSIKLIGKYKTVNFNIKEIIGNETAFKIIYCNFGSAYITYAFG